MVQYGLTARTGLIVAFAQSCVPTIFARLLWFATLVFLLPLRICYPELLRVPVSLAIDVASIDLT